MATYWSIDYLTGRPCPEMMYKLWKYSKLSQDLICYQHDCADTDIFQNIIVAYDNINILILNLCCGAINHLVLVFKLGLISID